MLLFLYIKTSLEKRACCSLSHLYLNLCDFCCRIFSRHQQHTELFRKHQQLRRLLDHQYGNLWQSVFLTLNSSSLQRKRCRTPNVRICLIIFLADCHVCVPGRYSSSLYAERFNKMPGGASQLHKSVESQCEEDQRCFGQYSILYISCAWSCND